MDENGTSIRRITTIATLLSLALGALIQFTVLTIWGARIDYRVDNIEKHHIELEKSVQNIDERGSRNLPVQDQRIRQMETNLNSIRVRADTLSATNSATSVEVGFIRQEIVRLTEQQRRIIEALDSVYNKTNELSAKVGELDGRTKTIVDHLRQSPPP